MYKISTFILSPARFRAKTAAFFADIQQLGTARFFGAGHKGLEGISAVGLRYLAE